jgi:hypothetical protein
MEQKHITQIQLGVVDNKVGWVFEYDQHPSEAFALHLPIARQFMQSLQELILLMEQSQAPVHGPQDGLSVDDSVQVRLSDPFDEEDE